MEWYWALATLIGMVIFFMALGVPVAFTFIITNIIGVLIFMGTTSGWVQIADNSTQLITRFTLGPVPMFIMMGALFFHTGLAIRVFDGLDVIFGKLPGRLCFLTVAGGSLFSTLTGSSMANTAMLGSLMVPEMQKRGYNWQMSMGPILGTGGLAMIIPPSALGVLLASVASIDVGKLLIAGFIPGFVLAGLYALMILLQLKMNPESAPAYDVEMPSVSERIKIVCVNILPMGIIVFMVVGFIILGWATPTEAGAMGAIGTIILTILYRTFSWVLLKDAFLKALRVTAMIMTILLGGMMFASIFVALGGLGVVRDFFQTANLSVWPTMLIFMLITFIAGFVLEFISIMIIVVPVAVAVLRGMGVDDVWFCIMFLIVIQTSYLTPPMAPAIFFLRGISPPEIRLADMYRGVVPFIVLHFVCLGLLIIFPELALWLPEIMFERLPGGTPN